VLPYFVPKKVHSKLFDIWSNGLGVEWGHGMMVRSHPLDPHQPILGLLVWIVNLDGHELYLGVYRLRKSYTSVKFVRPVFIH